MKKFLLLLSFVLVYYNQLSAQIISPIEDKYNITVTRNDVYIPGIPGYADTDVTLYIKIASNEQLNTFAKNQITTKTYTFPVIYSIIGTPSPVRYVKLNFSNPLLSSGYYPLTTTVGDYTTILPVIYYPGQFGYGVTLYCTAPNQYNMRVTRFECHLCTPGGGTAISKATSNKDIALLPNPSIGQTEFYYTATDKETVSINITNLNGKVVKVYTRDVAAGTNKIPIEILNSPEGTYIVQWKSSTGKSGTLKMLKN
jgi:hypothetical protein